jgi:predicted dehydrogenase
MSEKIRIGVIGTSAWAEKMFLTSLSSHPQVELAALCGRDQERAVEAADRFDIPEIYPDYRKMYATARLDGVVVAAPDDLHYPMTMAALDAGLHVLCEKPLALTAVQAQEMYKKARQTGLVNMVMFTMRWIPLYRCFADLLQQGLVGRCYHCEFHYQIGYARYPEYLWRYDQQRANGVLGDLGVHMIDLARWTLGEITQVSASLGVHVTRPGTDGKPLIPANDSALLLVEFASGAQGVLRASAVNRHADGADIKVFGADGTLMIRDETIWLGVGEDEHLQKMEIPAAYLQGIPLSEPYRVFTSQSAGPRRFADAILAGSPASPDFYDGCKAQQVIEAALESQRSGRKVDLDLPNSVKLA